MTTFTATLTPMLTLLNCIAAGFILNDNNMSISENVGGISKYLNNSFPLGSFFCGFLSHCS
mgnify:CR=1 FL=1